MGRTWKDGGKPKPQKKIQKDKFDIEISNHEKNIERKKNKQLLKVYHLDD